jgi:hypothetical protein
MEMVLILQVFWLRSFSAPLALHVCLFITTMLYTGHTYAEKNLYCKQTSFFLREFQKKSPPMAHNEKETALVKGLKMFSLCPPVSVHFSLASFRLVCVYWLTGESTGRLESFQNSPPLVLGQHLEMSHVVFRHNTHRAHCQPCWQGYGRY